MSTTPVKLRPAQAEVHRAAHSQDLAEVKSRPLSNARPKGFELKPIPRSRVPL